MPCKWNSQACSRRAQMLRLLRRWVRKLRCLHPAPTQGIEVFDHAAIGHAIEQRPGGYLPAPAAPAGKATAVGAPLTVARRIRARSASRKPGLGYWPTTTDRGRPPLQSRRARSWWVIIRIGPAQNTSTAPSGRACSANPTACDGRSSLPALRRQRRRVRCAA
jgi:hypothetical protein